MVISIKTYYKREIVRLMRKQERGTATGLDNQNVELHRLHLQSHLANVEENGEEAE